MERVEPTRPFPLAIFILASVVWHALQVVLFNTVFEIRDPIIVKGSIEPVSVQIVAKRPDLSMFEWEETGSSPSNEEIQEAVVLPERNVPSPSLTGKDMHERIRRSGPQRKEERAPARSPDAGVHAVRGERQPFMLKGDVAERRVIFTPKLPGYPEWALRAAVELKLLVAFKVDERGVPYQVVVSEGSGDSQTDLTVIVFVEGMRFEPSLSRNTGSMEWEFRLNP